MTLTDEMRARILALRAQGLTQQAISVEVGFSRGYISRVIDSTGLVQESAREASRRWKARNRARALAYNRDYDRWQRDCAQSPFDRIMAEWDGGR